MNPLFRGVLGLGFLLCACGGRAASTTSAPESESSGGSGGAQTVPSASASPPIPFVMIDNFDDSSAFQGPGLWMELTDPLPVAVPADPFDGPALHVKGAGNPAGLDFFFHIATPFEKYCRAVSIWVRSDLPGATLTMAIADPEPGYFKAQADGGVWPHQDFALTGSWQRLALDFSSLGIDADHPAVPGAVYGAVHFVVAQNTSYDLWFDNLEDQPFVSP